MTLNGMAEAAATVALVTTVVAVGAWALGVSPAFGAIAAGVVVGRQWAACRKIKAGCRGW
jgi:Kef-type K+ transport system membrane component KefB